MPIHILWSIRQERPIEQLFHAGIESDQLNATKSVDRVGGNAGLEVIPVIICNLS